MFRSNPNREFLNIELMTDPAARDCLEDILASVISWWGRRYELMFASSWSFDFKPGSGELVGPRLDAEISPALDLLETHHGIRVSWGYPFNRSYNMFSAWRILALASTTRARLASFKPGFEPMRTAWTTSNGCGGPTASSVRVAATKAVGAWAMAASCVRRVRHAVR